MSLDAARSDSLVTRDRERLVVAVASGLAVGYAALLAIAYFAHFWILDAGGHPTIQDFAAFWSAGHLARDGAALAVYDPRLEHAAEVATIGHPFATPLGWSYPPLFLFVASSLARIPYVPAYLLWCIATLLLYARAVALAAGRNAAFLVACAAPWALLGLMPGQNGFLTASLIGLALFYLEERPILSGLFLGLLSYKPQFGILFPLALAAGGYWRAFASAAVFALASNGLAAAVFGTGTFDGFVHSLTFATQNHLAVAGIGWRKLQSVYGLMRACDFSAATAWVAQGIATSALAIVVFKIWRAPFPYALKAAALAAAATLATPYVFVYDLPVLSVAIAFLFRHRGFDKVELVLLVSTVPSLFAFLWLPFPSALFTSLAVAAIAARRLYASLPRSRISPSWVTEATSLPSSE